MKPLPFKLDVLGLFLPLLILASWSFAAYIMQVPSYILPAPGEIIVGLWDFISGNLELSPYSGQFLIHSGASITRVLAGFFAALACGLPLGILTGRFLRVKRIFDPLIHLLRMIPGIGWLPIAMVWFGVGNKTTIFLIALAAFFPIYLNTAIGVKQVPEKMLQAAMMLGAEGRTLFIHVIIPAAAADILSGMRLGLGISWAYLVLGELTGVAEGLGAVMMDARMLGNPNMIIICMIVIAFWGRLSDRLLVFTIKKLHPAKEVISHE